MIERSLLSRSLLAATLLFAAVGGLLAGASPASAQSSGDGFLFQPPRMTLSLHGGVARADAGSEIFTSVSELLTLGRADFAGFNVGSTVGIRLTPRLDLTFSGAYSGRTRTSEFRDWVDLDDVPIEQRTNFVRVPLAVGGKLYLLPRGESIGTLAWIPARVAPYVGAGAGAMWYRFRQTGDFVDFVDLSVFEDEMESSGWAPMAHALAGLEVSLTPRLMLTGEAQYLRSRAELDRDFRDFDQIDLSGFTATFGIALRL